MEKEARTALMDALKSAYDGMIERGDRSPKAFEEYIEPLLSGLSGDERYSISSGLYSEWFRSGLAEKSNHYLGLAWQVHPWSSGS